MSKVWQPQDKDVYRKWIEDIIMESEEKLTDWERGFISSLETRLDNNWQLSEPQAMKLESIYARLTK
jgi:hypothetical protein